MIKEILSAAGVEFAQGRFLRMPEGTHAVYFDDVDVVTADPAGSPVRGDFPRICTHHISLEVYEPVPDDKSEADIEAELNGRGLQWSKQDRYWLKDVQRYQVIYEFTYITKH